MDHFVVDRPESVEVEHLLVPLGNWLHFAGLLVSDAVVDELKVWDWDELVQWLGGVVLSVAWKEVARVVDALNKAVNSVSVGFDRRDDDCTIVVL